MSCMQYELHLLAICFPLIFYSILTETKRTVKIINRKYTKKNDQKLSKLK